MAKSFLKWNVGSGETPPEAVVMNNGSTMHDPSAVPEVRFTEVDNRGYRMLAGKYPERILVIPSDRHAASIDAGLDMVGTRWCILVDDDVLFQPGSRRYLRNVSEEVLTGCAASTWGGNGDPRLLPFPCVIDVDRMRADGVRYHLDEDSFSANNRHGTGYHILREARRLGWKTSLSCGLGWLDPHILHIVGATIGGGDCAHIARAKRSLWG